MTQENKIWRYINLSNALSSSLSLLIGLLVNYVNEQNFDAAYAMVNFIYVIFILYLIVYTIQNLDAAIDYVITKVKQLKETEIPNVVCDQVQTT